MKASSATEFCPPRNLKWVVCSVNADFGRNVNIAKFGYVADYSLNCRYLYRLSEIVSLSGIPWRLIMYRNRKKELTHSSQKEKLLSYFMLCFLITFIWRGQDLMNGNTFAKIIARKKTHFHQPCS